MGEGSLSFHNLGPHLPPSQGLRNLPGFPQVLRFMKSYLQNSARDEQVITPVLQMKP